MAGHAVDSLTRTTAPAEARRNPDREDAGVAGVATLGFDVLLDVARDTLGSRARQMDSDAQSSGQIFEAKEGTSREQRETALRDDFRRDLQTDTASRYDRSSVGSRSKLASAASETGAAAAQPQEDAKLAPQPAPVRPEPTLSKNPPVNSAKEPSGSVTSPPDQPGAARLASDTNETRSAMVSALQNTPMAGLARASGITAPSTEGRTTETVAGKVGQALGAARVSGAESSRAAAPAANLPETRDPKTSNRPPSQSASSQQTRAGDRADRTQAGSETAPTKFDELVRLIRLRSGNVQSSARMHLNPPELGRVRIDVRMEGERLQIDVRTVSDDAKKVLTERSADLRAALAEQGITVDRFDVDTDASHDDGGESSRPSFEQAADRQQSNQGTRTVSGGVGSDQREADNTDSIAWDRDVVAERRLDIKV